MEQLVNEALRYLGVRGPANEALRSRMTSLAAEVSSRIIPRHIWRVLPLRNGNQGILLGNLLLPGRSAAGMLAESRTCALMVCTLGAAFDAWLRQLQARDMSRAVMLDALGSALIESACDKVETEIAGRFPKHYLTDRFSPGYGDLPLALQPELLSAAEAQRIGVTVSEACLMSPLKSVTALIGIADAPQAARIRGCAYCTMNQTCTLRKAGITCEL